MHLDDRIIFVGSFLNGTARKLTGSRDGYVSTSASSIATVAVNARVATMDEKMAVVVSPLEEVVADTIIAAVKFMIPSSISVS